MTLSPLGPRTMATRVSSAFAPVEPIGLLFENRFLALNEVVVQHGR